jgi:hypothetical protein
LAAIPAVARLTQAGFFFGSFSTKMVKPTFRQRGNSFFDWNVGFGSLADISMHPINVRFHLKSGHSHLGMPLRIKSTCFSNPSAINIVTRERNHAIEPFSRHERN